MQGLTKTLIYRTSCNKLLTEESPANSLVRKITEKYDLLCILILTHVEEFQNLPTYAKKENHHKLQWKISFAFRWQSLFALSIHALSAYAEHCFSHLLSSNTV